MKGPHQSVARSVPGFGNAGNHVEVCIELDEPVKQLLGHRGSIYLREESWIQRERFLSKDPMIYPTIFWGRHRRLVLARVRMSRILTAHSKCHASRTEIAKDHPPSLYHYHESVTTQSAL